MRKGYQQHLDELSRWESIRFYVFITVPFVLVGILYIFFGFNEPQGPYQQFSGTVISSGFDASSQYSLPQGYVTVLLTSNEKITALVPEGRIALPKNKVDVEEWQHGVTGTIQYRVSKIHRSEN